MPRLDFDPRAPQFIIYLFEIPTVWSWMDHVGRSWPQPSPSGPYSGDLWTAIAREIADWRGHSHIRWLVWLEC